LKAEKRRIQDENPADLRRQDFRFVNGMKKTDRRFCRVEPNSREILCNICLAAASLGKYRYIKQPRQ
jgi:hypothetical protein